MGFSLIPDVVKLTTKKSHHRRGKDWHRVLAKGDGDLNEDGQGQDIKSSMARTHCLAVVEELGEWVIEDANRILA